MFVIYMKWKRTAFLLSKLLFWKLINRQIFFFLMCLNTRSSQRKSAGCCGPCEMKWEIDVVTEAAETMLISMAKSKPGRVSKNEKKRTYKKQYAPKAPTWKYFLNNLTRGANENWKKFLYVWTISHKTKIKSFG